jgi:hypothetical protein
MTQKIKDMQCQHRAHLVVVFEIQDLLGITDRRKSTKKLGDKAIESSSPIMNEKFKIDDRPTYPSLLTNFSLAPSNASLSNAGC